MTPLQKLPKNVGDLGKLIVAKGFKKLPKVQSGHTGQEETTNSLHLEAELKGNISYAKEEESSFFFNEQHHCAQCHPFIRSFIQRTHIEIIHQKTLRAPEWAFSTNNLRERCCKAVVP